jgi:hypothetical protein
VINQNNYYHNAAAAHQAQLPVAFNYYNQFVKQDIPNPNQLFKEFDSRGPSNYDIHRRFMGPEMMMGYPFPFYMCPGYMNHPQFHYLYNKDSKK